MTQDARGPGRPADDTETAGVQALCMLVAVACVAACGPASTTPESEAARVGVARHRSRQLVRLTGTVEAVRAFSVNAPRLTGQPFNTPLVITRLVGGGARVEAGDVLVAFDPQEQQRVARDQRSALLDLEGQIRKLEAEQEAARATDDAELVQAANDVERSRLDVRTNPVLSRIEAEMNDLALEQALAKLEQWNRHSP